MARVLILGGGFGGVATARRLREQLGPDDEILIIDKRDYFIVGFRKTWALLGESLEKGKGSLRALERQGIGFLQGSITALDPTAKAVEVDGNRLEGDAMVVALGAALATDRVPGFKEYALNIYNPEGAQQAASVLEAFQGGKVLVGVFGKPYKCPPAPYEIAILVKDKFETRGIRAVVEVFTPLPMSMPLLGDAGCNVIEGYLAENGVSFLPSHIATAVEDGEVVFTTGRRSFDLLLGVAPHIAPKVVRESGLTNGGAWIKVNPKTLETPYPDVYAIGDVTAVPMANGNPLPKAGVFAEGEGIVVADRIAARLAGREPEATFEGRGGCFLEVGKGQAVMVQGHFLAEGAPQVELTDASAKYYEDKVAFEETRLREWFS